MTAALPLLLALALLGVPPSGASGASGASGVAQQAQAAGVTVVPRAPMVGERTVFSGRLAGAGRPVTLQRRTSSGWRVVARTRVSRTRTYRLAVRVMRSGTYRVRARAAGGRPRFTSARIGVTVARQAAGIQAVDAPFVVGLGRIVTARVTPARNGRVVVLQKYASGAWTNVANARTNATGIVKISYPGTTPGLASYRVVGTRFNGSATIASPSQALRTARATELLSATTPGDDSFSPSLSDDGRWVTFTSESQLLPSDTDALNDVYLFDRLTGSLTHLLPTANSHTNNAVLSANGRYVALQTLATNLLSEGNSDYDVFVIDRTTGVLDLISQTPGNAPGNSNSYVNAISDDGRFVAFASYASDLVTAGPPPNTSVRHPYVHDRNTGVNKPLDRVDGGWSIGNVYEMALSGDGTAVVFASSDDALDPGNVDSTALFGRTMADGVLGNRVNLTPDIAAHAPSFDRTGDLLAFATGEALIMNDTNNQTDAYVRTATDTYVQASPFGSGDSGSPSISGDGRYVAVYTENALPGDTNGSDEDIVVWDRVAGTHRLATKGGPGSSAEPQISANGSVLAFFSRATGLAPGTTAAGNIFAAALR